MNSQISPDEWPTNSKIESVEEGRRALLLHGGFGAGFNIQATRSLNSSLPKIGSKHAEKILAVGSPLPGTYACHVHLPSARIRGPFSSWSSTWSYRDPVEWNIHRWNSSDLRLIDHSRRIHWPVDFACDSGWQAPFRKKLPSNRHPFHKGKTFNEVKPIYLHFRRHVFFENGFSQSFIFRA